MGYAVPQFISAVVSWVAKSTIAKTILTLAATTAVSKALTKKPRFGPISADVEYNGTIEARRIIYGEMLVSGLNVIPPLTSGDSNQFLHQVIALSGHECNQIGDVYFNRIAIGGTTAVTGTDDDGKVTTGTYQNKAWVRRYNGTDSQTADYKLTTAFPAQWTAAHRGRGVAYLALTYQYDENVYKTGKPEVTALVQGKKIYDPRKDSTNGGSGSHRLDDPSTFEYSNNPALCLADYLLSTRLGLGEDTDRIDWELVATAADICDETVAVPGGTQARYTTNVVLNATDRFEDNIQTLAQAMVGVCYYSAGLWRMYAGAWQTPSFTLDESDLIEGGLSVVTAYPYNERYNSVRGTFVNRNKNWQPIEYQPVINTSYVASDGEQAWLDTQFTATTNEYEAQRHAILLSRRSRNGTSATLRCGLSAWKIQPFDTGTVSIAELGWTNKSVRCESWRFDPAGFVEVVVRQESSSDWIDPPVGDYATATSVTTPTRPDYVPLPPTNLTAKPLPGGLTLSWTAPTPVPLGSQYEIFEHSAASPFSSATRIWSGIATSVYIPRNDTTTKYYWVLLRTDAGVASATEPPADGLAIGSEVVSTNLTATANPSTISKTDATSSITTGPVAVVASGGTSPYTYSWTRTAGATDIAADSPTAATTTFTGSSLINGSTYNATFECTVTDNVAATKAVSVQVSITRVAMAASASPTFLSAASTNSTITTGTVSVSVTGGVSPYSYAWTKVSGDTLTVNSPTSSSTSFTASSLLVGDFISAVYRCTVTDSTSGTPLTATVDVPITISRLPTSGGAIP